MLILTSSADLITQILGTMPLDPVSHSSCHSFDSFVFDDLDAPGKQFIFEANSDAFGAWENVILERNAASSQLVRLRQWRGSSVMTVACTGNGFIGQKNRTWQTFEGNLHWCAAIPVQIPVELSGVLQMIPAISMFDALASHWSDGIRCRIKPPNDIILLLPNPHKIAGCLTEVRANSRNVEMVRFGLSINLVAAPDHVEIGHLPAACCYPHFKNNDDLYLSILMALARSILENVRGFEKNLDSQCWSARFNALCRDQSDE